MTVTSTTTLRLSKRLKARISRAAKLSGATPRTFILQAIAEKLDREERRDDFERSAGTRWAAIVASGRAIAWPEMKRYLEARAGGKASPRPTARQLMR
ncbi:MAG: hypothetical protein QM765_29685 [Myxococcales bacterium]